MDEVEPLGLSDHESRFLCLDETCVDRRGLAARRPQRGERRARHRCHEEHHVSSARREAVDASAQDVEGITGNRKRPARRRFGVTERMNDLEREERIAVRRFVHERDERRRHGSAHPVPKDAGHLVHGEWPDVGANRAAIDDRSLQVEGLRRAVLEALGREDGDRMTVQTPDREGEGSSR